MPIVIARVENSRRLVMLEVLTSMRKGSDTETPFSFEHFGKSLGTPP